MDTVPATATAGIFCRRWPRSLVSRLSQSENLSITMTTYTLSGQLTRRSVGEGDDILHCGAEVVAEWAEMLNGKQVSLRWWVSDIRESDEAIKRRAIEQL